MRFVERWQMHRMTSPRPRHRLFWKLMLIFWGTLLVTILTNTSLTRLLAQQEFDRKLASEQIRELGQNAANIYETGGEKPLGRFLNRVNRERGIRALLLSEEGILLTPNSHGQRMLEQLADVSPLPFEALKPEHTVRPPHPGQPIEIPIKSDQGSQYRLILFSSKFTRDLIDPDQIKVIRLASTFIIIALASWLLSRHLARPMLALAKASRQMAQGDLSVRTRPDIGDRRDELGAMSDDFDHMAERIQTLVLSQQELFRNLSHEIRTPLTRQKLALELMRRQDPDNSLLDRLERSNEEIDQLTQQILDLTKLRNRVHNLKMEPIDLAALLRELISNNSLEAEHKDVQLMQSEEVSLSDARIAGDAALLYRAVENVLRNALKHTAKGSEIQIIAASNKRPGQPDAIALHIIDRGPGVPDKHLTEIFEPFFRVDSAHNKQLGGFGLGLAFAKEAIKKHGGEIQATNRKENGTGLVVTITLPLLENASNA